MGIISAIILVGIVFSFSSTTVEDNFNVEDNVEDNVESNVEENEETNLIMCV